MSMRMRFVALSVATLLFALAWFFVGFKPANSELTEVKGKVQAAQAEVAALQARLTRLQELKRNAKELRKESARLEKGLPTEPAVSTFIRQVQEAANQAGIDFLSVSPSVPSAPAAGEAPTTADAASSGAVAGSMRTITVSINSKGNFFAIESFVAKMEGLERAIKIDTFSLGGASPNLSLAINMKMFMGGPAAAAAPAAPGTSTAPSPTTGG